MAVPTEALFLFTFQAAFWVRHAGACRPFCSDSECITVHDARVDFEGAAAACREQGAELAAFQGEAAGSVLAVLSAGLHGSVWIGLRLPAGACSDPLTPLRGYEWTSAGGGLRGGFLPSPGSWEANATVCSPRCVSLSGDGRWAERACSDDIDGYLCRTTRTDACGAQGLWDSGVFRSSKGCSSGPCEHRCTDVKGGFRCSCFSGYIPDSQDPKQCKLHCAQQKCPVVCDSSVGEWCQKVCPDGFIESEDFCIDVDECSNNWCEHECSNTYGDFACSCREGFVLKDTVKCVNATGVPSSGVVGPSGDTDDKALGSSSSGGGFLWLWIFIVLVVVASIFTIRFYVTRKQRCRIQRCRSQSGAPDQAEA